jgi:hypothetical protein
MDTTIDAARLPVLAIAAAMFTAALLLFGRWRYRRSAGTDPAPPYADSFFLLNRLRSRVWPDERSLPAVGLNVVMAFCFFFALRFARLYLVWPHPRAALWGVGMYSAATAALALRPPWGWWLLFVQVLAALGLIFVRAVGNGSFDLLGLLLGALYALFLLYLTRRRAEFGIQRAPNTMAAPPN